MSQDQINAMTESLQQAQSRMAAMSQVINMQTAEAIELRTQLNNVRQKNAEMQFKIAAFEKAELERSGAVERSDVP
jgi:septal ring factor EnvC (AmiA/AmiB activator)